MPNSEEVGIIFSKEGVTQGDPLSMVVYGIGMMPLTLQFKREIVYYFQPWYSNDTMVEAKFGKILDYFNKLDALRLARGYFSEPTKSVFGYETPSG